MRIEMGSFMASRFAHDLIRKPVSTFRDHAPFYKGAMPSGQEKPVWYSPAKLEDAPMNEHAKIAAAIPAGISPAEWQARVDLAAVYRLTAHYGWDDVIYNHSSMRVPGEPRMFLMKKHDLLYTEVTASNLVKVSMDGDLDEKSGVNRPGFTLHGGVLSARDDVNCAVHVHTNNGMAVGALPHGLRMVSQQAIRFYQRIGYHAYEGITEDFDERARINKDLGKNRAMIMNHHGLLTVGKSARESFVLMKALIDAIDIQLKLECTGSEPVEIPAAICAKTAEQYEHHDAGRGSHDWAAYLRMLDTVDTNYRN
jgi:ribulose-5-phosphate 4-epimerase/fuculose-1-phosphate aldolase